METIFSEFGLEVGGGLGKQLTITRRKKENTKTRLPCGKQKVFKAILAQFIYFVAISGIAVNYVF